MADLVPWAILALAPDTDVFGSIDYEGDSVTCPLIAMQNRTGAVIQGLVPDPVGDRMMQPAVTLWMDSDHTQGTSAGGTYGDGVDVTVQKPTGAFPKTLRQTNPSGAGDFTFTAAFIADEGMVVKVWAWAPPSGSASNLFVYFNSTLRLAVEPAQPMRLQTYSGGQWSNAAVGTAPDAEAYLASVDGYLLIDVLAETDPNWTTDYAQYSDAPPSRIVITVNGGDEQFVIDATTLPAGQVRVTAANRQWGALLGRKRFGVSATVIAPPVTHPVEFEGTPEPDFTGYVPYYFVTGGGLAISCAPGGSPNQAVVSMTLGAAAGVDSTGYAVKSVFLTALTAEFPAQQTPPLDAPDWSFFLPVYGDVTFTYDSGRSLARASGSVSFIDTEGDFAPGQGAALGTSAFQLFLGMLPDGVTPSPDNLSLVMTGYTALRKGGLTWRRQGAQTLFTVSLDDRLIKANKACMYMPAADGTCHYWAVRQAAYRCGFTDDDLNFPLVDKYEPGEYQLSYGTTLNPKFAPRPEDELLDFMLQIRADSGDVDPGSGQIQPMVLGTDSGGGLDYFPLPIGVVQTFQNPGQDPAAYGIIPEQAFSAIPLFDGAGDPLLNEFLQFLQTVVSLDQIRSSCVFEGRDVATGDAVLAWADNPQVTLDPSSPGYIGAVDTAYVQISRRISSLPVAQRQAALSQALLAFPAIRSAVIGHLQPELFILSAFSVQDYATQGTDSPVGYYGTSVRHAFGARGDGKRYGLTFVGGPLLGQTE
jgi:hypothetical protein